MFFISIFMKIYTNPFIFLLINCVPKSYCENVDGIPDIGVKTVNIFGSLSNFEGSIGELNGFNKPHFFFFEYSNTSKPVIFRNALDNLKSFPYWSNDEYLKSRYGDHLVEVEKNKKEDRSLPLDLMTLNEFIDIYKNQDVYAVQNMYKNMMFDFGLPKPLQCGGFQNLLQASVFWYSSGGTTSVLHFDELDNIHCVLDGEKTFKLIDKKHTDSVESDPFNEEQGFSYVDVLNVNYEKFPHLKNIPWWNAEVKKGDCIYIPCMWYHTVSTENKRSLAINLWFHYLYWFDKNDCKDQDLFEFSELKEEYFLSEESSELEQIRLDLFESFLGTEQIALKDVFHDWKDILEEDEIKEVFSLIDSNEDSVISWKEAASADIDVIVDQFPFLLPEDEDSQNDEDSDSDEFDPWDHDEL